MDFIPPDLISSKLFHHYHTRSLQFSVTSFKPPTRYPLPSSIKHHPWSILLKSSGHWHPGLRHPWSIPITRVPSPTTRGPSPITIHRCSSLHHPSFRIHHGSPMWSNTQPPVVHRLWSNWVQSLTIRGQSCISVSSASDLSTGPVQLLVFYPLDQSSLW